MKTPGSITGTCPSILRHLAATAFGAVAMLAAATPAFAQLEIKLGHVGEPGRCFRIRRRVRTSRQRQARRKSEGDIFGSSQLGGDKEMLQKLKLGTLDMALPSTVMRSEVDLFGVFEMPYLVKDRAHMARIEKEIFWSTLAPEAEKKGLKVLAVWENGFARSPTTNTRSRCRAISRASSCAFPKASGGEDVPGLRRQSEPDEALRSVHRVADGRHGRPGESVHANLLVQVPGSPEVPLDLRPRLHAGVPDRGSKKSWKAFRPMCARSSKTPPRRRSLRLRACGQG